MIVSIIEQRIVVSSPGDGVADTPDRNSNASRHSETSPDNGHVVVGSCSSNVKLGDSDLDTGTSESVERALDAASTASTKMCLGANTIDRHTGSLPFLNIADHTGNFAVVRVIEIVVIDVQLGIGIGLTCLIESNADKVLAKNPGEDRAAQGAILVEDFIDDIPSIDAAPPLGTRPGYVVLDDAGQGARASDVLNPCRELGVPQERMASHQCTVALCKVDDLIGVVEGEAILGALDSIPLHRVLASELVELSLGDSRQPRIVKVVVVNRGTEVFLALRFHACTESTGSCSTIAC